MYNEIEAKFSDQDLEKAPVLKAVRRLFQLQLKVENNQITTDFVKSEAMAITNDLQFDLTEAEYKSAVINAAEAQRQRQLFQAAQQFLTPQPSNVRTCTPVLGAPSGTYVCN